MCLLLTGFQESKQSRSYCDNKRDSNLPKTVSFKQDIFKKCKQGANRVANRITRGVITEDDQDPWSKPAAGGEADDHQISPSDTWLLNMSDYSTKELTYTTDRLPAIAGMASRFHAMLQCGYHAGLWADDLPRSLGWYCDLQDDDNALPKRRISLNNGVPSWSWASIHGKVWWPHFIFHREDDSSDGHHLRYQACSQLLEARCEPATSNRFGEVSAGSFVKLRGKVAEADMECDGFGRGLVRRDGLGAKLVVPDCLLTAHDTRPNERPAASGRAVLPALKRADSFEPADPNIRIQGKVLCMLLYGLFNDANDEKSACVLILRKTGPDQSLYERVAAGTARYDPLHMTRMRWRQWEGWEHLEEWDDWE